MPWGVLAAMHGTPYRRRERYTLGWADNRPDNDIGAWAARCEGPDAWERYCKARRKRERSERINTRGKRMSTRLERRRAAIQAKWRARGKVAAILALGIPGAIIVLSLAWRAAVWAVMT